MSVPLGIDLGTTRTSVAMVTPNDPAKGWYGAPQVITLADGVMTPSAVLFEQDEIILGTAAKNMGHRAADCAQIFKRKMPEGDWRFSPDSRADEKYSAQDLSRILLADVLQQAKRSTGIEHAEAVITVPAYFGEPERRRTSDAAKDAGLTVLDIINEPTAAIVSYLFQPGVSEMNESVLVFDLGGGTFDTVVVEVRGDNLRVVAIDGDLLLGGQDFDATIAMNLSDRFEEANPTAVRPTVDPSRKARLLLDIEASRESLSSLSSSNVPVWGGAESGGISLNVSLSREEVDSIVATLVDRCIEIAKRALKTAKKEKVIPTKVLFVGGMTKTPTLRNRVMAELRLSELSVGAEPDLMVAKGAAIWAQKLSLEAEFRKELRVDSLLGLDQTSDNWRKALRKINSGTAYDTQTLLRLLALRLRSISSRGYALLVRDTSTKVDFLDYLLPSGTELPYASEPGSYVWREEVSKWGLSIYEDSEKGRGTSQPEKARLVERVSGPMSRSWPKGSHLQVAFSMGLDQILHVEAWQVEDGKRHDPLAVTLATAGG